MRRRARRWSHLNSLEVCNRWPNEARNEIGGREQTSASTVTSLRHMSLCFRCFLSRRSCLLQQIFIIFWFELECFAIDCSPRTINRLELKSRLFNVPNWRPLNSFEAPRGQKATSSWNFTSNVGKLAIDSKFLFANQLVANYLSSSSLCLSFFDEEALAWPKIKIIKFLPSM